MAEAQPASAPATINAHTTRATFSPDRHKRKSQIRLEFSPSAAHYRKIMARRDPLRVGLFIPKRDLYKVLQQKEVSCTVSLRLLLRSPSRLPRMSSKVRPLRSA